ncbi:MAG: Multidrug resistance protein Stp [Stenotrophomonas maltophilia]|uniref:Multidrug resistance protein Stp n=1 Tax=Stenotrophomonas maltophilia TaxID=40324 RepID=A0A7V8FJW6_STEMA|nr:MAG: Multidrug resistance protein Stp [Stenotrophomonas maltophilia]
MSAASPRTLPLLLVASTGCAMTVLDTNVVGVVLPTIARDLHASFADVEWVISSYVLCFAALLLPAGAIADRFGRRRVFLLGIAVFALASLACGLAPAASGLYLARAAQGVGAAFLLAPALAIIGHGFHDPAARGRAWALWGGIMGLTMVLSPLLGGVINHWLGWRWAFHVNVPLCALLAAAVPVYIEESRDPTPRALDLPGIALFAMAMFSLTWALIEGPGEGWTSAGVLLRLGVGIALFTAFSVVERRRAHPMLDLRLFADLPFSGSVLAMFAYAATAQVMASLLPQFLQNGRG